MFKKFFLRCHKVFCTPVGAYFFGLAVKDKGDAMEIFMRRAIAMEDIIFCLFKRVKNIKSKNKSVEVRYGGLESQKV